VRRGIARLQARSTFVRVVWPRVMFVRRGPVVVLGMFVVGVVMDVKG
jgi:hypothetical protein